MIQNKIVNDEARDQLRDQGTATLKTKIKKLKRRKQTGKKNMENDRPIEWKDSKDSKKGTMTFQTGGQVAKQYWV